MIVVDGGSKDKTLQVIKENNSLIDRWVSEPDKGIYDAMNKGLNLVSDKNSIVSFLNSGDIALKSYFEEAKKCFSKNKNIVSKMGDLCIKLFHENSIGTVIKHIPGHGLAKVDSHNFTPTVKKSIKYLKKNDFYPFKNKKSFFAMTGHVVYDKLDKINTVTHSKIIINYIRKKIGFKNILISDDLSMKSLKEDIKTNTIKCFKAGCNLALHCNGNFNEMKIVANNSPLISPFIIKKTSQFYKILS